MVSGYRFVSILRLFVMWLVALVGYDPTTVFQSNFNATQTFWFDRFLPSIAQTPGTLCDTQVFNAGDTIVTNRSLFDWDVQAVYQPNAAESGFSYSGETLDHCDVTQSIRKRAKYFRAFSLFPGIPPPNLA